MVKLIRLEIIESSQNGRFTQRITFVLGNVKCLGGQLMKQNFLFLSPVIPLLLQIPIPTSTSHPALCADDGVTEVPSFAWGWVNPKKLGCW